MLLVHRGAVKVVKVVRAAATVGVLAAGALLAAPALPAAAAPDESITTDDVAIQLAADGTLDVTETIGYDFGANHRHGIVRTIPTQVHLQNDDRHDRSYPIEGVSVERDGSPEPMSRSTVDNNTQIKIGDPDNDNLTGTHSYVIRYTMRGVVNAFSDHDELDWNATGSDWSVPIGKSSATVTGPATVTRIACYAGRSGSSQPCSQSRKDGQTATFHQDQVLNPGDGLTVVIAYPAGTFSNTSPILIKRGPNLAAGFRVSWWAVGGGAALALLGSLFALLIAWRVGRDRYYVGQLPGLAPGPGEPEIERRKPLIGAPPVSVEFVPPDKVRPGQVGTIVDEKADVVDVTATIVDLAVRKHLHIAEIRDPGDTRPTDWQLNKLTDGDAKFLRYERTLFDALFDGRDSVLLSDLKYTFHTDLTRVRTQLYSDMVRQGWYRQSPARTRAAARALGVVLLIASVGVTALLAVWTHFALIGVGLVIAALVLLIVAPRFPARTGRGSAALARIQGFRLYIATAEAEQMKFQEREQIFSEYLPYAIVFGLAERWARIFSDIGSVTPQGGGLYWYTGVPGWNMGLFAGSLYTFTNTASVSLASTPPSASGVSGFSAGGGFAGGGAGGGGGGSW
jgi:hypothetical protein